MNEVYLIGNLAKDMELKESKNGKPMAVGTVGVKSGDMPAFVSLVAYNKLAEFMATLKKGQRVVINGQLSTFQDASKKTQTNVLVKTLELGIKKTKEDGAVEIEMKEEDLPF